MRSKNLWFVMDTSQWQLHLPKRVNSSLPDDSPEQTIGRDITLASSLSVSVDAVAGLVRVPLNCLTQRHMEQSC